MGDKHFIFHLEKLYFVVLSCIGLVGVGGWMVNISFMFWLIVKFNIIRFVA